MSNIKHLIEETALLFNAVSDSAKLDAQLLVAHAINKDLTYLHTWPDAELTQHQVLLFNTLVEKRIQGEPIAYILGMQEFWSLPFMVSPATLIPRPDTEILVETVLEKHGEGDNIHCLDLGTGTGAIALALASEHNHWHIEAIDYSDDAVALAKKNAHNLNLNSVLIYQSDWFSNVKAESLFDVIVSNPPYIDENDHHLSEGDVRFEPKSALVAGNHGLSDIVKIAKQATSYLKEQGYLYIEHGYDQGLAVQEILQNFGYEKVKTIKDYGDNDRITLGMLGQFRQV